MERKNYLFAGSDAGGERTVLMYSLIGTATLNGINPQDYLEYVSERISDCRINRCRRTPVLEGGGRTGSDPSTIPDHKPEGGLMELTHIEDLIDCEGQINIGYLRPVGCVAVANDEYITLATLRRRLKESFMELLQRLDQAIERAVEYEEYIDKSNAG